jgi:hypothetical protein
VFKVFSLFGNRDLNDVAAEVIFYYLFTGDSLTHIEYKLFNTEDYHGWFSKAILNYFGIDTDRENKGVYRDRNIKDVISELHNSNSIHHIRVAKVLNDKFG